MFTTAWAKIVADERADDVVEVVQCLQIVLQSWSLNRIMFQSNDAAGIWYPAQL